MNNDMVQGFATLLRIGEVAEILNISPASVRKKIYDGRLESVKIGRSVRVRREAVEKLIRTGVRPAREPS